MDLLFKIVWMLFGDWNLKGASVRERETDRQTSVGKVKQWVQVRQIRTDRGSGGRKRWPDWE